MLVLAFGLGLGVFLCGAGWVTYKFAPRVGPNPFFGVRTGYNMVNREVWDRSNRVGGVTLAGAGVLIAITGVVLSAVHPANDTASLLILIAVMLGILAATVAGLVLYTKRLVAGAVPHGLAKLRLSPWWLLPGTAATSAAVAFLLVTVGDLPTHHIATHFDLSGAPNGWMNRTGYLAFGLAISLGIWGLFGGLLVLLPRIRIPSAKSWERTGAAILKFLAMTLTAVELLMGIVFADTYWFNTRDAHLFSPAATLIVVLVVYALAIPAALTWIFLRFRSETGTGEETRRHM